MEQEGRTRRKPNKKAMARELEWIRSSPKARQAKSKARIKSYEQMVEEAGRREQVGTAQIQIPAGPRLGGVVIEADTLKKGFRRASVN